MDFTAIKNKLVDQRAKVKQGLTKGGDLAKQRFGHGTQIDQGEKKINEYLDQEAARRNQTGPDSAGPTV